MGIAKTLIVSLILLTAIMIPQLEKSYGQVAYGEPVGQRTISPFDLFEVGIKLERGESVRYNFNSDITLFFDIHSHDGNQVHTYEVSEGRSFEGLFIANSDTDYYFLAENLQLSNANLQYSIQILPSMEVVEYDDVSYEIFFTSNSQVSVTDFNPSHKTLSLQIETPYLTSGFVNMSIPRSLLDGPFEIQGILTDQQITQTDAESIFVLHLPHGVYDIVITGTTAVPEIPLPVLLLTLAVIPILVLTRLKNVIDKKGV